MSFQNKKNELRKDFLEKRNNLSIDEVKLFSLEIEKRLFSLDLWEKSSEIFTYIDFNNEVITRNIINESFKLGKKVSVPICNKDCNMKFYKINSFEELSKSSYGILEPKKSPENLSIPNENSLIIVPLVAFNGNNQRIGFGKGYYDRYFSKNAKGIKIGLAYSFQKIDNSDIFNDFDIPLDFIIVN